MPELRGGRAPGRPDRVHAGHGVAADRARRARRRARAPGRALPRRGGLRAARQDRRVVSDAAVRRGFGGVGGVSDPPPPRYTHPPPPPPPVPPQALPPGSTE